MLHDWTDASSLQQFISRAEQLLKDGANQRIRPDV
jgi:hypothetical protein